MVIILFLLLQTFKFWLSHRKGKAQMNADFFSVFPASIPIDFKNFRGEICNWAKNNFPDQDPTRDASDPIPTRNSPVEKINKHDILESKKRPRQNTIDREERQDRGEEGERGYKMGEERLLNAPQEEENAKIMEDTEGFADTREDGAQSGPEQQNQLRQEKKMPCGECQDADKPTTPVVTLNAADPNVLEADETETLFEDWWCLDSHQ